MKVGDKIEVIADHSFLKGRFGTIVDILTDDLVCVDLEGTDDTFKSLAFWNKELREMKIQ